MTKEVIVELLRAKIKRKREEFFKLCAWGCVTFFSILRRQSCFLEPSFAQHLRNTNTRPTNNFIFEKQNIGHMASVAISGLLSVYLAVGYRYPCIRRCALSKSFHFWAIIISHSQQSKTISIFLVNEWKFKVLRSVHFHRRAFAMTYKRQNQPLKILHKICTVLKHPQLVF